MTVHEAVTVIRQGKTLNDSRQLTIQGREAIYTIEEALKAGYRLIRPLDEEEGD